jgi:hypothetical protein
MKLFRMVSALLKSVWFNLTLREREGGWNAAFTYIRLVAMVYGVFRNSKTTNCFK